ncbi:DUF7146 domain-containing protein [Vitreoscilla stercoraria]|uniref:Toprim domain-containing protein n=2 Tax=Vitreoscilla stercoraria TaxID=61 RepID=A0ABY4EJL9_VITST|nr:toprim domain-containing protein [Vitreoscilla stercoraria]UOO93567.1 toprim domain-containing protein [Vitreoscilla stercoraria]
MIDFKDIAHHAIGQWHYVLTALGVPAQSLTNKHQPCPACGGKDRFRFDDKQGKGTFICSHMDGLGGDGFALVQHVYGCDIKEAMRLVAGVLGMTEANPLPERKTPPQPPQQPQKDHLASLCRLWAKAEANQHHTGIKTYLQGRGLDVAAIAPALGNLGFVEALDYWESDQNGQNHFIGQFPAIVAKFESVDGQLTGLHRTYLNSDHTAKLNMPNPFFTGRLLNPKKMMARFSGSNKGAAIHLTPADNRLAVCEGIENATAVYQLTKLPVWACGAANGMASMAIPDTVKELFIFADTDANQTGIKAARELQKRALRQGIKVRLWESGINGMDVLDMLDTVKKLQEAQQ